MVTTCWSALARGASVRRQALLRRAGDDSDGWTVGVGSAGAPW